MDDSRDAIRWLEFSLEDLRAARQDYSARPVLRRHVVYNCQQAVEKGIKAVFIALDRPFKPTHDLTALGAQLADQLPEIGSRLRDLDWLKAWAVKARYPDDLTTVTDDDCRRALDQASEVVEFCRKRISPEG
jgi:HEPN domain-containing protein